MEEFSVKFILPGSFFIFKKNARTVKVTKGTDILTAAVKAGIILNSTCGGEGLCGKCKVIVGRETVLACKRRIEKDIEVTIPEASLEIREDAKDKAEEFTKGVILKRENVYPHSPFIKKTYLEKSSRTDVAAYINGRYEVIATEPGDTAGKNYAFAFDIGTTTVAGQLVDLNTRTILGSRIVFNKQAVYGSDVITRIVFASSSEGLESAHRAVITNINEIIDELIGSSGVHLSDVYAIMCAGNMTMMHLLLKVDPSAIRKPPYVPVSTVFPPTHSSGIGVDLNPRALAAFLPGVSTYVGGDIVGGILACGVSESGDLALLVDIGTNGEIVLGNSEWMIGSAASAGPAFEGSGLGCGMKAVKGAIQKIDIDADLNVSCDVIGGQGNRPRGICGSGYIDLLCRMLERGIIDKAGKLNKNTGSKRIRAGAAVAEFVVAFKSETGTGKDIVIDEDDIENLKRSKGAIYSAITALVAKVEKDIKEVKKIYIAGGFGNYLNIPNAISIGLLPDVAREVYEFVGNSSLAGARMSLFSTEALRKTDEIRKSITYIDLSAEPSYMDEYIASLFFPHTDLGRFPSVRS